MNPASTSTAAAHTAFARFTRRLDLTSLHLFVMVCECGSIGKTAERAFLANSAVSKRLSDLEVTLGTPLLYRHARGVSPTPAGQSLLHHARTVLFSLDQMHSDLTEYAHGIRGHVRIHANLSALVQFLPEDLGQFTQQHEGIKIDLAEHVSTDVVRAVQEGAADIGLCHISGPHLRGLHDLQVRPYRTDELVVVVPRQHPLCDDAAPTAFVDTLQWDHVGLHANSSIYLAMQQAAKAAGRSIRLRFRVAGLDVMCRMIQNGLGIGLMPKRAFELLHGFGTLVALPLSDEWAHRHIDLVARDFDTLPIPARLLVEHLSPSPSHSSQQALTSREA